MYLAIILVHESVDDAEQNVSLLEQRIESTGSIWTGNSWKQWILDTDIHTEGKVLLAKLYTPDSSFWAQWVFNRDTLLLYEQE